MTWTARPTVDGFGQGDAIHFLYKPELGIGDSNTWLFSTQAGTRFRTSDGGRIGPRSPAPGSFTAAAPSTTRRQACSTRADTRKMLAARTMASPGPQLDGPDSTAIFGDGTNLYTGKTFGPAPILDITRRPTV